MYLYDPGILPGSAYQCILGNVYLRSDLSSNPVHRVLLECIVLLLRRHPQCTKSNGSETIVSSLESKHHVDVPESFRIADETNTPRQIRNYQHYIFGSALSNMSPLFATTSKGLNAFSLDGEACWAHRQDSVKGVHADRKAEHVYNGNVKSCASGNQTCHGIHSW